MSQIIRENGHIADGTPRAIVGASPGEIVSRRKFDSKASPTGLKANRVSPRGHGESQSQGAMWRAARRERDQRQRRIFSAPHTGPLSQEQRRTDRLPLPRPENTATGDPQGIAGMRPDPFGTVGSLKGSGLGPGTILPSPLFHAAHSPTCRVPSDSEPLSDPTRLTRLPQE